MGVKKIVVPVRYPTNVICSECLVEYVSDNKDTYCPCCGKIKYNPLEFNYTGLKKHKKE